MAPPPHPELESILSILSATAHRNKNQHRLSKWWKPFSQLRRHVSALISELEVAHNEEQRYGVRHRKTTSAREAVERRAGFLIESLVPRGFLAFSALVADNQYAALGLMLIATLARVRRLVLPLKKEVVEEKGDAESILGGLVGQSELDLGEVIRRVDIEGKSGKDTSMGEVGEEGEGAEVKKPKNKKRRDTGEASEVKSPADSMPAKRPKKKRKKGDAFDDIFDSLI